jgi:hypothetical protein
VLVARPVERRDHRAAHSTPAYEEFKAWAWIGDIAEGIEWALKHPAQVTKRIAEAQAHIERHLSPAAIAAEWEKAFIAAARLCASVALKRRGRGSPRPASPRSAWR